MGNAVSRNRTHSKSPCNLHTKLEEETMRVLLKVEIPGEEGNKAARDGSLGKKIQTILDEQKPGASYFTASNGMRAGYIFFSMNNSSEIPKVAEPWFLTFNATEELLPVMNPEDLMKPGPHIEQAVKKYG